MAGSIHFAEGESSRGGVVLKRLFEGGFRGQVLVSEADPPSRMTWAMADRLEWEMERKTDVAPRRRNRSRAAL